MESKCEIKSSKMEKTLSESTEEDYPTPEWETSSTSGDENLTYAEQKRLSDKIYDQTMALEDDSDTLSDDSWEDECEHKFESLANVFETKCSNCGLTGKQIYGRRQKNFDKREREKEAFLKAYNERYNKKEYPVGDCAQCMQERHDISQRVQEHRDLRALVYIEIAEDLLRKMKNQVAYADHSVGLSSQCDRKRN